MALNAKVVGTGFFVPEQVVTNEDLATKYGIDTSDDWIKQRTGIEERRFAENGVFTSDLGTEAAKAALADAGMDASELDMILFATLSPDMLFPGCGVYMQKALGLPDQGKFVPAMDIRNQCSGFLYGLATATSMIRGGGYKNVLLVGAEIHSAGIDLTTRGRNVASLFGDGAGAVILQATEEDTGVRSWNLGADGRHGRALCQRIWDISQHPFIPLDENGVGQASPEMMYPYMEGRLVFKNAVERQLQALMQVFAQEKTTLQDVDLFLFHQANLRIVQYLCDQVKLPEEKVFNNIQRYGNTTAATIPILLAEAKQAGKLKPGMRVAMAAFGSGFTWGAAIVDV